MNTLKTILIVICCAVIFSCGNDNSEKSNSKPATLPIKNVTNDTIYKSADSLIIRTKNSIDTLIKFTSKINDNSYSVKPEDIKLNKKLDFSNYEYKKKFITTTKESVEEQGVNFAGHFCFVYWGCGSPCKLSAIIDMRTGEVLNGISSEIGYQFRKDSKVLIVNPPDSTGFYNKDVMWQIPSEYIWTGRKLEKIKNGN